MSSMYKVKVSEYINDRDKVIILRSEENVPKGFSHVYCVYPDIINHEDSVSDSKELKKVVNEISALIKTGKSKGNFSEEITVVELDEKEKELNKWFLDNLKTKVLNKSEVKEKLKKFSTLSKIKGKIENIFSKKVK